MTDSRKLIQALRAYQRAEEHQATCDECDDYPCDTGMEFWQDATSKRRAALPDKTWSNRALGLDVGGSPLASRSMA